MIACEIGDFFVFFQSREPSSYHTHSRRPSFPVVLNWRLGK
jgi:hypothetical protein